MLKSATVLFGIVVLGGLVMAVMRFNGLPRPPTWLATAHGLLAGTALTLLIYTAATAGIPLLAQIALGMFLLAAAGGVFMNLNFHRKLLPLPPTLLVVHGAAALYGFAMLCCSLWTLPDR